MIDMNIMRPPGFSSSTFKKFEKDAHYVSISGGYKNIEACPVCGSNSKQKYAEKFDIEIAKCSDCGLIFSIKHPNDFADLYSNDSYLSESISAYDDSRAYRIERFATERVGILRETFAGRFDEHKRASLLDIGCGTGWFLEHASETFDVAGVEYSETLLNFLRERFGFEVYKTVDELSRGFDYITAFDVIEHVPDPLDFLRRIKGLLNHDGVCLIYTPNSSSAAFLGDVNENNLICPPHHLYYFNEKSFSRALSIVGLRLLSHKTRGLDFFDLYAAARDRGDTTELAVNEEQIDSAQHVLDQAGLANHSRYLIAKL